jgi:N-acetylglucosamine-6-phosphate deacetylase
MLICGRLVDTGKLATITIEAGRIAAIRSGRDPGATFGLPDLWLSPAFLDLQLNGYGGYDFNRRAWAEECEVATQFEPIFDLVAASGTAMLCPTITTNSREGMLAGLAAVARAAESDVRIGRAVVGVHVEGPYIASEDGPRGAHPLEHVRDPDWDEFLAFQEAAGGRIRIITLAPERPGALPFIERLTESGVLAAIGHTGAAPETIRDAVRAGARMSTHLGNGAHAQIPRHPNYIWEQLGCDELHASLIADGHHLPPSVVKCMVRAKGADRVALVSDAVSLGGLSPGSYAGGRLEVLDTGKIVVAGTPYLAGAGHLLDTCVANAVRFSDLTLAQAVRCATTIPAQLLGLDRQKGQLRVGADADLTLFRLPDHGPLEIEATLLAGEVVYQRN